MAKNNPSFDTRLYGFRKLSDMIRKQSFIEVQVAADGTSSPLMVRLRPNVQAVATKTPAKRSRRKRS